MITCQFEHGKITTTLRHTTVDALMVRGNKILLTKRAEHLKAGGKWSLPGGFMDRDETTVEAVMREVHEETGYTCAVKELITVRDKPNRRGDDRQNVTFIFLVEPIKQVQEHDSSEVTEQRWFDLTALPAEQDFAFDHLEIIWEYIATLPEL